MSPLSIPFTATRPQVLTYLLAVALFSITFLVFLNSATSFLLTDRIGTPLRAVGDAVGTLGFADELVALVACPLWGVVSDRVGVRSVAVAGYLIVGAALALSALCTDVFPQLLMARLLFSLGGSATATMVTAILPSMTAASRADGPPPRRRPLNGYAHSGNAAASISSELTITPVRYLSSTSEDAGDAMKQDPAASTSQLAGLVGMFTGLGALIALLVLLPLPARFQSQGVSPADAIIFSFYTAGAVAVVVSGICFVGLRNLPGEQSKSLQRLFGGRYGESKDTPLHSVAQTQLSYLKSLQLSFMLGLQDVDIGLGYLGGFVARASSVAISLFIPLFVNAYFIRSGICDFDRAPKDPSEVKRQCSEAYIVAAKLTGTSQLVALLCAPVFGYLSGRYRRYNLPLVLATFAGILGYAAFGSLRSPDPASPEGSAVIYLIAALLGISQIGAIVCSLGQLGRGIQSGLLQEGTDFEATQYGNTGTTDGVTGDDFNDGVRRPNAADATRDTVGAIASHEVASESTRLLPSHLRDLRLHPRSDRAQLKGAIAGLYSLAGGAGILLLTKAGGLMFDRLDAGAPFWLMAGFNAILFVAAAACAFLQYLSSSPTRGSHHAADDVGTEARSGDGGEETESG